MTVGKAALDLWTAGVVLALGSIGFFLVAGAVVSLLTVAGAWRRSRRPRQELGQLAGSCSARELAEIDDVLDRILAEEQGGTPSSRR